VGCRRSFLQEEKEKEEEEKEVRSFYEMWDLVEQEPPQQTDNRKKLFVLVGPPAIGKTTWIERNAPDAYVVNRDDIVNQVAGGLGLTYDDMFANPDQDLEIGHKDPKYGEVIPKPDYLPDYLPEKLWSKVTQANGDVFEKLNQRFAGAGNIDRDVVVDMTNMDVENRKMAFDAIGPTNHKKIAVVFNFQGSDVQKAIMRLAQKRAEEIKAKGGSKTIPEVAFQRMFDAFEPPTAAEGFEEIISIDDRQRLLQALKD
jgi:hypothetical protein